MTTIKEQLKGCVSEVQHDFNYLSEETVLDLLCDCLVECGKIDKLSREALKDKPKTKVYRSLSDMIKVPDIKWLPSIAKQHILIQMAVQC